MAKIAENYKAVKFSKLVKKGEGDTFELAPELDEIIEAAIESVLKEAGEEAVIVEVVEE